MRTTYSIILSAGQTSDAELITEDVSIIIVTLSFPDGTGSAKVQTTTDELAEIADNTAIWIDWDQGTITVTTTDTAYAPRAIRLVNSGATRAKMTVRGNY